MQPVSNRNEATYQFDVFELDPVQRVLLRDGNPIALKPKIFETLLVLVRNSGRVMDKDELMLQVWPDTVVEEVNLAHNISILRKALGQKADENRFIVTVPGRGYGFVAEVRQGKQNRAGSTEYESNRSGLADGKEATEGRASAEASLAGHFAGRGIRKPVSRLFVGAAVLAVVAIAIGLLLTVRGLRRNDSELPASRIKSLAVLPFKPLIAEGRDESLEMGMADTLITRLSNIRDISVRPVGAVLKYSGIDQDAVAAGREQKVDAVVDGHMQKAGDKIRVTVRLVRVEDGAALWSNQFDEKMTDIFQLQDSISERVAGVLAPRLTGEEKERLTKHPTENAEAYQLYLLGRFHLNRLTDDGTWKSLEYFQQAIAKDANFALAHAGLAESYNALGGFNVRPPKEVTPKARYAAEKALELDPLLVQAHTQLGLVSLTFDWNWSAAEREFKRALEINPSDSDARYWYGYNCAFVGRFDEGIAEVKRARELDPVSLVKITGVAQILLYARRYDEAIEECWKALEMDPNLGFAHWLLGLAYMYKASQNKGSYEPAILELQKSIPLSGDSPDEPAALAQAYVLSGKKSEAKKIVNELERQAKLKYISTGTLATLYALLGESDRAFALFDNACEERDNMMVILKVDPYFDPLRSDPRFTNLVRRVGFPE